MCMDSASWKHGCECCLHVNCEINCMYQDDKFICPD
uniref:Uncharacterized protein n=1 Tax=Anguilla anguilla TaxID=7936 RepID=A0A0E9SJS7_ANGAN